MLFRSDTNRFCKRVWRAGRASEFYDNIAFPEERREIVAFLLLPAHLRYRPQCREMARSPYPTSAGKRSRLSAAHAPGAGAMP